MNIKKAILLILLCFTSSAAYTQNSEIGAMAGTSFYLGDINPNKVFTSPEFCAGMMYRYNFDPRWAIRANILFGTVSGSDFNTGYERNLSFRSQFTEISVMGELNFFRIFNIPARNRFSPYICAGFSLFSFDPTAEVNGQIYHLQALGTEGQGLEGGNDYYSLVNVAIPFGFGFKVNIGKRVCLGAEWGMRYTFTDYLDDVSGVYFDQDILTEERGEIVAYLADPADIKHTAGAQRGNSTTKDIYHYTCVTVTVKIGNEDNTCNIRYQYKPRPKIGRKR